MSLKNYFLVIVMNYFLTFQTNKNIYKTKKTIFTIEREEVTKKQ